MSFTRGNGTERKQTEIEPTLFHDRKKISIRYYIKDDSTFNGTALSPNELIILWNKLKMHGHFKVEKDLQNFHVIDERNLSTSQFHHHVDSNKSVPIAFETLINNNVACGELNNLENIVYDTSVDNYQEIPSYQFNNQYTNTLCNPLDQLNFMDNSNLTVYDEV
ncbi:hypothetical protein PV326_011444 [Microctonus aethiopoides]|nr:hypothetical protein PV326_011444 [Microctonus aethiopoides]